MKKIAIFGGTFNPIHWGHLLIAETALDQAQLDQVLWVPTHHPPHKSSQAAPISYHHRSEMVRLAIAHHPNFRLSTIERDQIGKSYASDTLSALQQSHPQAEWFWIIGLDAFRSLPRWHNSPTLVQTCHWLVAPRFSMPTQPGLELSQFEPKRMCEQVADQLAQSAIALQWQLLSMPIVDLSASLIRDYCRQGRSIRYLVPESVRTYLLQQRLYQDNP